MVVNPAAVARISFITEDVGNSPRALEKENEAKPQAFIGGRRGPRAQEKVTKRKTNSKSDANSPELLIWLQAAQGAALLHVAHDHKVPRRMDSYDSEPNHSFQHF